jgi:hypothetical protein
MTEQRLPIHPYAELFPPMTLPDFERLCDDIQQHGLQEEHSATGERFPGGDKFVTTGNVERKTPIGPQSSRVDEGFPRQRPGRRQDSEAGRRTTDRRRGRRQGFVKRRGTFFRKS